MKRISIHVDKKSGEMEIVFPSSCFLCGFPGFAMSCHIFCMDSHVVKPLRVLLRTSQRPLAQPWWSLWGRWGHLVVLLGSLWAPWEPLRKPLRIPEVTPRAPWGGLGDTLWSSWVAFGHLGTPLESPWGSLSENHQKPIVF